MLGRDSTRYNWLSVLITKMRCDTNWNKNERFDMSKKKRRDRRESIDDKAVWAVVLHDEWDHTKYIVTDLMTYEQAKLEMAKIDTTDDNEISYHQIEQLKV